MNDDWLSFDLIEGVGEEVPNDDDPKWKSSEGWGDGKFRATKCSWLNQEQAESINHAYYSLSSLPSRIILKRGSFKNTKKQRLQELFTWCPETHKLNTDTVVAL